MSEAELYGSDEITEMQASFLFYFGLFSPAGCGIWPRTFPRGQRVRDRQFLQLDVSTIYVVLGSGAKQLLT